MLRPEHAKLSVYAKSVDAAELLDKVVRGLPREHADLKDQLRRASISTVLNIAEGAGEFSDAEKARFYRMSRRSSAECLAILDLIERLHPVVPTQAARQPLLEIGAMLTTMITRRAPPYP